MMQGGVCGKGRQLCLGSGVAPTGDKSEGGEKGHVNAESVGVPLPPMFEVR